MRCATPSPPASSLEDETAYAKLLGSGAVPASTESALFEMLRDAKAPEFKAVAPAGGLAPAEVPEMMRSLACLDAVAADSPLPWRRLARSRPCRQRPTTRSSTSATTTCAEFVESNGAARKFYVFWFDGYLAGKHGTTVFDADRTQKRLDAVLKACESNVLAEGPAADGEAEVGGGTSLPAESHADRRALSAREASARTCRCGFP